MSILNSLFSLGRLHVSQDLCNFVLDFNCPIATLLPSTTGMGVCSTSLVFFLVKTHNDFLGAYRSATNQQRYEFLHLLFAVTLDKTLYVMQSWRG